MYEFGCELIKLIVADSKIGSGSKRQIFYFKYRAAQDGDITSGINESEALPGI